MNPNPLSDVIAFLLQPAWTTGLFWLITLTSIGIAVYAFRTVPGQRKIEHVGNWAMRFLIGFRNRMAVAVDWLWSYLTYQRGARLITGQEM